MQKPSIDLRSYSAYYVSFLNNVIKSVDYGSVVALVRLDVSVAYNTVSHAPSGEATVRDRCQ